MTESNSTYSLYLGAYNRNKRNMYRKQTQVRHIRKMIKESDDIGYTEHLLVELRHHEDCIQEYRARMNWLEQNAERNGFDLRRRSVR